ncbi:hypothetical protein ABZ901_24390 [Actinacidiphila alni]|uniref:hypothetical protein n=1 Tax=Actinacidiphila alni TaxID=380248 RepID=UPI00340975F9
MLPRDALEPAARAARAGRYEEAVGLLDGFGGAGSEDPDVLDLLARIHAQRGELAEADALWAAAPSPAATAGRRRIAALHAGRYRAPVGRRLAVAVLVVAAAGAMVAGVLLPRTRAVQPADPAVARNVAALSGQVDRLRSQLADTPTPSPSPPSLTAADLSGPGVTVTREGQGFLVTFDDALFPVNSSLLTSSGRAALDALAARLRRAPAAGPLVVTGHTDAVALPADSPYPDHVTLGYARAQRAAARLSASSGVPLSSVGLRSTGTLPPTTGSPNSVTLLVAAPTADGT